MDVGQGKGKCPTPTKKRDFFSLNPKIFLFVSLLIHFPYPGVFSIIINLFVLVALFSFTTSFTKIPYIVNKPFQPNFKVLFLQTTNKDYKNAPTTDKRFEATTLAQKKEECDEC